MTNNILAFDVGGVKGIIDTNTKVKRLEFSSTSTAASSFHTLLDRDTGAIYQVPVGKKTTIIYCNDIAQIENSSGDIIYADNQDGNTNAVILFARTTALTATNFIMLLAAVPAQKYINFQRSALAGTKKVDVYAIEEAA